ncbi:putative 4-hydroxy-4-methyl-2-oxoglutarate aldolase [Marinomonas sp. TW1]|uniref:putative 4-hydroxy-4-methyl-2-oxoglutarate aldolase n=1 Tax=Marinomonas sp. TW1 TaxID=1561203 RepID=UPI0007AF02A9|nr:putative 4-hydroxy-4-methyl-2-oxoglutarate aldolase [Marinomonas sp. TW1]KZN12742.1 ribonuclease activity regulator protein RraA [Marinomonas sp. TW1]
MKDLLPDLCDLYPEQIQIAEPVFQSYGKRTCFYGQAVTVSCFEDNSRVRELVNENGQGRVMVVDGGGSKRRALLGDMLAEKASKNGWEGFVIHGAIRDVNAQSELDIGIHALCAHPLPTEKKGLGKLGQTVSFAGIQIAEGDYIYCDLNGTLVSKQALPLPE